MIMMRSFFFLAFMIAGFSAAAQRPTDSGGVVTILKDPRVDILGKKMAAYNEDLSNKVHTGKGYRLMVISTSDRDFAMKVRSQLYQLFPDQKQYMSYQVPNIKIKFGNYIAKDDAEKVRKQLIAIKLVPNNIYIVPETIEIKPEKKDNSAPLDN